jgi:hypothetical protein
MHDDVVIDEGQWDGRSGPTGTFEMRLPPGTFEGDANFQTARNRGLSKGSNFYFALKRDDSVGPPVPVIHSPTTIGWRATFDPFKRELPRAYPWMHFGSFDLLPEDKDVMQRMVDQDTRDGILRDLIPEEYPRKLVIGSTNFGLVLGSAMGAAVSMDAMHSRAVAARLARGEASPVLGAGALAILFPGSGELSWDEVDEARRLPGMRSLRSRLAEFEAAAWEAAEAGHALEPAMMHAYSDGLQREIDGLRPSLVGAGIAIAFGATISVVTGPLPLAIGIVAGAGEVVAETAVARYRHGRSWMAAADRLRKVSARHDVSADTT